MNYTKDKVKKAINSSVIFGDGHTIYSPSLYDGFNVDHLIREHYSDLSNPKATLTDNKGTTQKSVKGVYNLDFLYHVASECNVEYTSKFGRGSQARAIVSALEEWANSED
jgi:hypothetical protein